MTQALHPPRTAATLPPTPPKRMDSDRLLILTIAVILAQNHASVELILALLYIAV